MNNSALKEQIRQKLLSQYSGVLYRESFDKTELETVLKSIIQEITLRQRINISEQEKNKIISEMVNELAGFGPIETIMNDPEVTEIMINGPHKI